MAVDNTKVMLGTFSPQQEPYTYALEEETTPSGMFARGSYSARSKVKSTIFSSVGSILTNSSSLSH